MKGEAPFSPRGPQLLLDTIWSGAGGPPNPVLLGRNAYIGMIETAQNVADRYQLSRKEIDAFALRSQQHARAARDSGRLAKEIMPVTIPATRKTPRPHRKSPRIHPRRHHPGAAGCPTRSARDEAHVRRTRRETHQDDAVAVGTTSEKRTPCRVSSHRLEPLPATSGSQRDSRTVLTRRFTCSHWCYPDFQIECIPCRNPEG